MFDELVREGCKEKPAAMLVLHVVSHLSGKHSMAQTLGSLPGGEESNGRGIVHARK